MWELVVRFASSRRFVADAPSIAVLLGRESCAVGATVLIGREWCDSSIEFSASSHGIESHSSVKAIGDVAMRRDWSLAAPGVVVQVGFARSE